MDAGKVFRLGMQVHHVRYNPDVWHPEGGKMDDEWGVAPVTVVLAQDDLALVTPGHRPIDMTQAVLVRAEDLHEDTDSAWRQAGERNAAGDKPREAFDGVGHA